MSSVREFLKTEYPEEEEEEETKPIYRSPIPRKRIQRHIGPRIGYWKDHEYKRRSTMTIRYFCGWKKMERLINKGKNELIRGLLATLFETGGRANEVLSLEEGQFRSKRNYILVTGMLVLKQKKEENRYRQVPILKSDPLTEPMLEWLGTVREIPNQDKLFTYRYNWLYKWIVKTDKDWWPHRFRAERASQLAIEKNFTVPQLMKWFGWSTEHMATHYVRMSVEDLVEKMSKGEM